MSVRGELTVDFTFFQNTKIGFVGLAAKISADRGKVR
jgi:hypothetical protein